MLFFCCQVDQSQSTSHQSRAQLPQTLQSSMPPSPRSSPLRHSPPYRSSRRSHSRSRSRSRSPPPRSRNVDRSRPSTGGFRWKDKSKDEDRYGNADDRKLDRGYRDRDRRDRDRDRADYRNGEAGRYGNDRADDRYGDRDKDRRRERDDRYGGRERDGRVRRDDDTKKDEVKRDPVAEDEKPNKEKKEKKKEPKIAPTAEPLIIVNVNDRLGTKAAVPCLASDSIRGFKAMVAARIGREPHEIMLKRQGERPFKDQLTLEDYGVSNGVQLDLEVDTGD
ncbi:MAG: hypothetical protein Q9211_003588 [Gyalolechia sp. 1 TL-2023]